MIKSDTINRYNQVQRQNYIHWYSSVRIKTRR